MMSTRTCPCSNLLELLRDFLSQRFPLDPFVPNILMYTLEFVPALLRSSVCTLRRYLRTGGTQQFAG